MYKEDWMKFFVHFNYYNRTDEKTAEDSGILAGEVLHLVLALRGGN